ncbi:hypothetical protein PENTCL1PPCAC_19440, partial [Pristionchus entomophagus]
TSTMADDDKVKKLNEELPVAVDEDEMDSDRGDIGTDDESRELTSDEEAYAPMLNEHQEELIEMFKRSLKNDFRCPLCPRSMESCKLQNDCVFNPDKTPNVEQTMVAHISAGHAHDADAMAIVAIIRKAAADNARPLPSHQTAQ